MNEMAKTFGAHIFCCVCGAQPFPDDPEKTPERYDLMRLDANGDPSDSPNPGCWYCDDHNPHLQRRKAAKPLRGGPHGKHSGHGAVPAHAEEALSQPFLTTPHKENPAGCEPAGPKRRPEDDSGR